VTDGLTVTPGEVVALTARTGYSRFPVAAENGPFMGYLHVKDVLDLEDSDRAVPQRIWRPMATLRSELPLDDALTVMRRAATHLAQVADPSGKVLGVVALEDVLELLVGEVRDPAHRVATEIRLTEPRGSGDQEEVLAT
ncbi:CBS domain-containing protein, partial [Streptomyces spiralis]